MAPTNTDRVISVDGTLYMYYAGPYRTELRALQAIDSAFAEGLVDVCDRPVVHKRAVYVRY